MKERGGGREGIRRGRGIKGNERWKQGKRREGRRERDKGTRGMSHSVIPHPVTTCH